MSIARYISKLGSLLNSNGQVLTAGVADASVTQAKLAANVAGNGPAFSAYGTTTQTIATSTLTKVILSNKDFDTNNNFDATTNYRFTPTVAGYYQITGSVAWNLANNYNQAVLYKNGSIYAIGPNSPTASLAVCSVSKLIYLNGTTDYVELFCGQYSGSNQTTNENLTQTFLTGALVRAA